MSEICPKCKKLGCSPECGHNIEGEELKFVCPECGHNKVSSMENVLMEYSINSIRENGEVEYGERKDGHGMNDSIDYYACSSCGFIIDENNTPALAEWIKDNCSQE
jgi:rubrerythrin